MVSVHRTAKCQVNGLLRFFSTSRPIFFEIFSSSHLLNPDEEGILLTQNGNRIFQFLPFYSTETTDFLATPELHYQKLSSFSSNLLLQTSKSSISMEPTFQMKMIVPVLLWLCFVPQFSFATRVQLCGLWFLISMLLFHFLRKNFAPF